MILYRFTPPEKHRRIYIFINIGMILSIIGITILFHDRIEIFGIPIALWLLFNGLWSTHAGWYSWFHRKDKSSFSQGLWLICLVVGLVMSILLAVIYVFL